MCVLETRDVSTLLVIGATGDVGSGCARCLAPLVKRVMLYVRNAASHPCRRVEGGWNRGRNRNPSRSSSLCGRHRDLSGEPGFTFASVVPHCTRSNHLRCGLPEKPEPSRGYVRRPSLLWWSWTDCGRVEFHARFQRRPESASIPRCCPLMFTRRHGPRPGATFRAVLPGARFHHAGADDVLRASHDYSVKLTAAPDTTRFHCDRVQIHSCCKQHHSYGRESVCGPEWRGQNLFFQTNWPLIPGGNVTVATQRLPSN
jgi:hypothetical protein